MVNEDTQGNVKQLQAELKKLKEQLAQALAAGIRVEDVGTDFAPGGPQLSAGRSSSPPSFIPSFARCCVERLSKLDREVPSRH